MTATIIGNGKPVKRELVQDKDGHRDYDATFLVRIDDVDDGPEVIANVPGLPQTGSIWNFGNDSDPWAFCWPNLRVTKAPKADWNRQPQLWEITRRWSTKPLNRCQDQSIGNPILEPQKLSGSFIKYAEMAHHDKDGNPILSSSFEKLPVEFDANRPQVQIGQNVLSLELPLVAQMVDRVNNHTMWGLGLRRVKLSDFSWERKLYGLCNYYYTRRFVFDINFNTFDKTIADAGHMVLKPSGNKDDPRDFCCLYSGAEVRRVQFLAPTNTNDSKYLRVIQWQTKQQSRIVCKLEKSMPLLVLWS
jgi:hypothetical protein